MLDYTTFIRNLLATNYHRGNLHLLKLFSVSPTMRNEIQSVVEQLAPPGTAFLDKTAWTRPYGSHRQFSLFNKSGDPNDRNDDYLFDTSDKRLVSGVRDTALATFFRKLPTPINFRLNTLGPRSGLSCHEEDIVHSIEGKRRLLLRFHLAVTSVGAEVVLDGHHYRLGAGDVYFFHNGCFHSAHNPGTSERYHLVWDTLLDPAVFDFYFANNKVITPRPFKLTALTDSVPSSRELQGNYERLRLHRLGFPKRWYRTLLNRWQWRQAKRENY